MNARHRPVKELVAALAAYQASAVIPHCAVCVKPCCRLDRLVLDLKWKQVKILWKLDASRAAFDRQLAEGKGPEEIREGGGRYYIHSKPCPAYDEAGHACRVYDRDFKPAGCSDFPVYEDRGSVMADLRCEAVDIDALAAAVAQAVGPTFRIVRRADREFPFLVTLSVRHGGRATDVGTTVR